MTLLYKADPERGKLWAQHFAQKAPEIPFRLWPDIGDPAAVRYLAAWQPPEDPARTLPNLEVIFSVGAGIDQFDLSRVPPHIAVVRMIEPGIVEGMVEYVTHAVLRYLRRFDEYEALQRERRWQVLDPHPRDTFTVGVLGLGVLGAHVAQTVARFGMPVRGYSRSAKQVEGITTFAGEARFDAFLDGVKVLVNLLPHTPDTANVLNTRTFSKLARGAYLINVARGAHLVEADLLDALASGQLAAATLDVFQEEPLPPDHPFWQEPRITVTPHMSALTLREESVAQIAQKMLALERGEAVGGVVNIERGY